MKGNPVNIHTPLMKCLEKMLEAELALEKFHTQATATGVVQLSLPDLNLLDFVLTIIGFPEDNSAHYYNQDDPSSYDDPACFCRDWLYDKWAEVEEGKLSINNFITWAQIEIRGLNATT